MMKVFKLIHSNRKTIAIQVKGDGRVIVRAPLRMSSAEIDRFVASKEDWINRHLAAAKQHQCAGGKSLTAEEIRHLADAALQDIPQRVQKYAAVIGVTFGRITIRNQKTRWGSCSAKGNLNFNCLLMLCPEDIRDYVIVHELCHRKELNHSPRFWHEVSRIMPDYAVRRQWLREHGSALIQQCENPDGLPPT